MRSLIAEMHIPVEGNIKELAIALGKNYRLNVSEARIAATANRKLLRSS